MSKIEVNQIRQWIEHFNNDYFVVVNETERYLLINKRVEGYIVRYLNTGRTQFTTKEFTTRFSVPYQFEDNNDQS